MAGASTQSAARHPLAHVYYNVRIYRGDAGRYVTGVAQPVNIAGWNSGWWVP